jgi:succinate dehydrogenase/fumarate reductase flavoprotein subunit
MNQRDYVAGWKVTLWGTVTILLCGVLIIGGCAGTKAFNRSQKRADANNRVKVTSINIRNAQQQAKVVRANNARVAAEAQQRYISSTGIRRAQDEISKTLTPLYVQWEAIQAQFRLANSPTHTQVYIPSGANGVPIVQTAPKP